LKGGAGHDVLVGGADDDLLVGGSGRDVLIGGVGADRLVGNADDDVLIAGATAYDLPTGANQSALAAVMGIWVGSQSYSDRVAALRNGLLRSDGTVSEVRVYDDGEEDVVTGSAGQDWFLVQLESESGQMLDKITDLSASEFADDLYFINVP
jgi:Ca2+-binding RTX toxin-like protein